MVCFNAGLQCCAPYQPVVLASCILFSSFILGFLPNNSDGDNKLTITGEGKLNLLHSFGVGEEMRKRYETANPSWMSVAGLMRYWSKRNKD